jgi:hypothetical protein
MQRRHYAYQKNINCGHRHSREKQPLSAIRVNTVVTTGHTAENWDKAGAREVGVHSHPCW